MKFYGMMAALCLAVAPVHAQERTASGPLETQASWSALKSMVESTNGNLATLRIEVDAIKKCGTQSMIYAPGGPNSDASGCASVGSSVQVGTVTNTSSYSTRTVNVTFPKPFAKAPKVYLSVNRYYYHDNCRQDQFRIYMSASSITQNGFRLTMPGGGKCGGEDRLEGVTWIAVAE